MTVGTTGTARSRSSADERYRRNMLFAVFAVTLARLLWLAAGQTDLYPDEAQYWFWSLHPAFGYYSKPPVVAWLIALTTALFGDSEFAVRLAAPLLHYATALIVFELARRLYDSRIAAWSAVIYATLPGVTVSSIIISTDAPLLTCWAAALYAFVRAREEGGGRWWLVVGAAAGIGLLSKYAMTYWLISALLFLVIFRDERRHLARFLAATGLALAIYAPNFVWNLTHGFASYRHTEDNASLHGSLFHPESFLEFFGSQFGVFGPLLFAALIIVVLTSRRALADRRAALLASFALPTLAMMFVVSFLSRAQPNWSAPAYVSATVLVVAWLIGRERKAIIAASVALHVAAAVLLLELTPLAAAGGYELPAKYDPLHRLRGWRRLGDAIGHLLVREKGAALLSDDREDMAALLYYVRPRPEDWLKWNGEGGVHDQFDLTAEPARFVGRNFLLVSHMPENTGRILERFAAAGPIQHVIIPLGGGEARTYTVRLLTGFKGYR
jgi:4-amino-4-deoxy-L-arabinose transferase-like glycosyltransferase